MTILRWMLFFPTGAALLGAGQLVVGAAAEFWPWWATLAFMLVVGWLSLIALGFAAILVAPVGRRVLAAGILLAICGLLELYSLAQVFHEQSWYELWMRAWADVALVMGIVGGAMEDVRNPTPAS